MSEKDKAAENLEVIRSLMERATVYRAISGPTALFSGVLASGMGVWFQYIQADFFYSWVVVLLSVVIFNTCLVVAKAKREKSRVFSPGLKMALVAITPGLLVGGVIGWFSPRGYGNAVIAWIWMLSYGLSLMSTKSFSPKSLWWLGLAFIVTGLFWFRWIPYHGYGLREVYGIPASGHYLMIYTFGFYHIAYGLWVVFIEKNRS